MNALTLNFNVKDWGNAAMLDKYGSEKGIGYKFGGGRRRKKESLGTSSEFQFPRLASPLR
jgi:hypothetical protein